MTKKKNPLYVYIKEVYEQVQINKQDIWPMLVVHIILSIVVASGGMIVYRLIENNGEIFFVTYVIMLAAAVFNTVITTLIYFSFQFLLGIKMSMSRPQLILRFGSIAVGMHLMFLGISWLIYKAVVALHISSVFVADADLVIPIWGWILLVFGPVMCGAFAGAIVARFGKIGGTIMYFVFLVSCFLPSFMIEAGVFDHVDITITIEDGVMACIAMGLVVVIGWIDVMLLKGAKVR